MVIGYCKYKCNFGKNDFTPLYPNFCHIWYCSIDGHIEIWPPSWKRVT